MKKFNTSAIAKTAIIAAVYASVTLGIMPFSFGAVQFRVSEILVLLAFIDRAYIPGLVIGCIIANLFSPMGIVDVAFGSFATYLSVYMISKTKNLFVATLYPVIFNSLIIGLELYAILKLPFLLSAFQVGIGEFVVVTLIGYPLFKYILNSKVMMNILNINKNQNIENI